LRIYGLHKTEICVSYWVRLFENSGRRDGDSGSWKAEKNGGSGGFVLNDLSWNFVVKISLFSEVKIDGRLENDIDHRNAHK
jgi:hypothetical protein